MDPKEEVSRRSFGLYQYISLCLFLFASFGVVARYAYFDGAKLEISKSLSCLMTGMVAISIGWIAVLIFLANKRMKELGELLQLARDTGAKHVSNTLTNLLKFALIAYQTDPSSLNVNRMLTGIRYTYVGDALRMWLDEKVTYAELMKASETVCPNEQMRRALMRDVVQEYMRKGLIDIEISKEHVKLVKWLLGDELGTAAIGDAEKKASTVDPRGWTDEDPAHEKPAASQRAIFEKIISEELGDLTALGPDDRKNT